MKIEVGKTYIDNDGDKIEIIRQLNGGNFVGIGVNATTEKEFVIEFDESGVESTDSYPYKLVREYFGPARKEMWATVDINTNQICNIYDSKNFVHGISTRVVKIDVIEKE